MYVTLIDGDNERDSRGKLEEATIIENDALRWSPISKLGRIDGKPVLRGMKEKGVVRVREIY